MGISRCIRDRRGVVIESALLFLLVIFMLCLLLLSQSLVGRNQTRIENNRMRARMEVEQLGELYIGSLRLGTEFVNDNEKFECTPETRSLGENSMTEHSLTVRVKATNQVVLYITAHEVDGEIIITGWRDSLPAPA